MIRYVFLLCSFLGIVAPMWAASSPTKAKADSAYVAKNYVEACRIYTQLAEQAPSADVFYNLGNAHYRMQHTAQAVLAYERALHLDPAHADARYNLAFVKVRLPDRFAPPSGMFFVGWAERFVASQGAAAWTELSFAFLLVLFFGIGIYLVARRLWLRKAGFAVALVCASCFLATTIFAIVRQRAFLNNRSAVVMADEVQTYTSATENSKPGPRVHAGTTVVVVEQAARHWREVELPDGSRVWINAAAIELVAKPVK